MIGEFLKPAHNSLNLLRLLAALAVIVSHSFPVLRGDDALEPLDTMMKYNLGQQAVGIFFVISGLTLARSWADDPNLRRFALARILRIFPALLAFGLVFGFLVGPFYTSSALGAYFSDGATIFYPISVALFFDNAIPPPGVFANAAMPGTVNVPLWTIEYELLAYLAFGALSFLGLLSSVLRVLLLLFVIGAFALGREIGAYADLHSSVPHLIRLGACFLSGVLLYRLRHRIPRAPASIPLAGFAAVLFDDGFSGEIASASLAVSTVIGLGFYRFGRITPWTQVTDLSYGVYIYGWPVQQALAAAWSEISLSTHIALSLLIASLAGYLSWHTVEWPSIRLKHRFRETRSVPVQDSVAR